MGGSSTTASPPGTHDRWARMIAAGELFTDAGNPVTVRLLRQQARSLTATIVFTLVLLGGVIATVVTCTLAEELLYIWRTPLLRSELLFLLIIAIWTAVSWIAQPMMFITAVRQEREEATWNLLDLTGMAPLRILFGVIGAAAIQQFLLLSMMAPFLVMAWMLNGIDPKVILISMLVVPLNGLITVCVGIKGTVSVKPGGISGRPGRAAIGASLAWLLAMFLLWAVTLGRGVYPGFFNLRALDSGMVVTILLMANLALHIGAGALVDAAMRLTHPAANRSTIPRVMTLAFSINLMLVVLGLTISNVLAPLQSLACTAFVIAVWNALTSIDGIAEPYDHTRRQADWYEKHHGLWRLLAPGAAAARQFHLALALPALIAGIVAWSFGRSANDGAGVIGALTVGAVAYGLILLMVGDVCARAGDRSISRPLRHRRVIWGIIILGTLAAGFSASISSTYLLTAFSPILGLGAFGIAGSGLQLPDGAAVAVVLICMGGVIALLVMIDQARYRPQKHVLRGEPT